MTTGRDGRLRILAMPRDAIARALIRGPGIETSDFYILQPRHPKTRVKNRSSGAVLYGTRFDHAACRRGTHRRHRR